MLGVALRTSDTSLPLAWLTRPDPHSDAVLVHSAQIAIVSDSPSRPSFAAKCVRGVALICVTV